MSSNPILWSPSVERMQASALFEFMSEHGFDDYASMYRWSVEDLAGFWQAVARYCNIRFDAVADTTLTRSDSIIDARWFTGARLNYAANLLRHDSERAALVFCAEGGGRRTLSWPQLRESVAAAAAGLMASGVVKGDRVAGFLPNCPEAVIGMLATASIGAVWSSCSPDFGSDGVIDRFAQIRPKVLLACNGYTYNGKVFDTRKTVATVAAAIPAIERVVVVPFADTLPTDTGTPGATTWDRFVEPGAAPVFAPVAFDHPLFVMFSSGTTGAPKCIVHGHGGTLLQHCKEHRLHTDIGPSDRLFYFTTCGWMMWNWLASGLASGATLVLFDGSPFFNDGRVLWQLAEQERISVFGSSAKYISALEKAGVRPGDEFSLTHLRTLLSTGSPLAPESFDYVYETVSDDLLLASISGGTDILSCFALGNPLLPVRRGELQCRGLGMAAQIFDESGNAVVGVRGELVCTRPFPSRPVGFWNDPDRTRYRAAYFERFDGVWAHGDFAELTELGGVIIHGRSDSVLNP